MNVGKTIGRIFRTKNWLAREADNWARTHFRPENVKSAAVVAEILVERLHVDFGQLFPATHLVQDLKVNEWSEWTELAIVIKERLGAKLELTEEDATVQQLVLCVHEALMKQTSQTEAATKPSSP